MGQPQVQAQLVQVRIGPAQVCQPFRAAVRVGIKQRFLEVQRGILQALRHHKPLCLRELLAPRQQPRQQIVGPG